jgi:putative transposase
MPRPRRVYLPNVSVHVYLRGHNCAPVFHDVQDYQHFLKLLRRAAAEHQVDIHAFALMTNHYHLITTPRTASALATAMQQIDGGYVRYYNRRHNHRGTVWCGRYDAKLLVDERYFWTCFLYVERNPVDAGLARMPEEYVWSSYRRHAHGHAIEWLAPHPLYLALGATCDAREAAYRVMFAARVGT